MKNLNAKQQEEYNSLSAAEKKIYESVISHFPATSHDSAMNVALQGGVKFDFIPT